MQTYIHSVARTHRANYVKQKSNHKKGKPQHRAEKELPESREKNEHKLDALLFMDLCSRFDIFRPQPNL